MRAVFLLRIACKEIDDDLLASLGLDKKDKANLKTIFTKPKGKGWDSIINFIHKHREEVGLSKFDKIFPLLDEWNSKNREGFTTKRASQLALYFYEEIDKDKLRYRFKDKKEQLIEVILKGSSEIKDELRIIFDEVLSKKQKSHLDRYYDLIQTVLSSALTSLQVVSVLPEYVIKLAELFWYQSIEEKLEEERERREDGYSSPSRWEIEDYFCISTSHREYEPASAYQTPAFQLFKFIPKTTIDFILAFTNKTVECFAKSKYAEQVEQVEIYINENEIITQYVNPMLWNTYRGTQNAPALLESLHMALEKFLLDYAKTATKENLEYWCLYLIKNSISASITALVGSIVLANPSKLFNVAKVLFRTREFFQYDTSRTVLEMGSKSYFGIGSGMPENEIFVEERIKSCEDGHRKNALEHLAVNYQFFRFADDAENEPKERQEVLWEIFDNYYSSLPEKSKQTESDKIWRLYLARMDRRKMNPEYEQKEEGVLIKFNPEIDDELKKISEESSQYFSESMKFMPLMWWSTYRFRMEENRYKEYQQYESDFRLALSEAREIFDKLKSNSDEGLTIHYAPTPLYTCAVVLRDYFDQLSDEEKEFCKEIILDYAYNSIRSKTYPYQVDSDVAPAIFSLPLLMNHFPEVRNDIKSFLFLLLLEDFHSGALKFAIGAIQSKLWKLNYDDAQSIFLGYLLLKPRYEELENKLQRESYDNFTFSTISEEETFKRFVKENEQDIEKTISNELSYKDLGNIELLNIDILNVAFALLPLDTNNEDHKKFITIISSVFSRKLLKDNDKIDFTLKRRFFKKFAYIVLNSSDNQINAFLEPFVNEFSNSRDMADFFQQFVFAEDSLNKYEPFWKVWNIFYNKIVEICNEKGLYYYTKEIIHNYLLAAHYWLDVKKWDSLKEREKLFFRQVAQDIGNCPPVLFSLSKLLDGIGSDFLDDGIYWISGILRRNENLLSAELETNTIYYMENSVRKYVLVNRQKIKITKQKKLEIVAILDFLVEKGSVVGYLLREDIL